MARSVLDTTGTPIFALDREYRYLEFNRAHADAMRTLYGCEIDRGVCLFDVQAVAEDRKRAKACLDKALAGQRVVESAFSGDDSRQRRHFEIVHTPLRDSAGAVIGVSVVAFDNTERKRLQDRNATLVDELQQALAEIKTLRGILPMCSSCKKIRDDSGNWQQVDSYISSNTNAECSHGLCPDCVRELYPDDADRILAQLERDGAS